MRASPTTSTPYELFAGLQSIHDAAAAPSAAVIRPAMPPSTARDQALDVITLALGTATATNPSTATATHTAENLYDALAPLLVAETLSAAAEAYPEAFERVPSHLVRRWLNNRAAVQARTA